MRFLSIHLQRMWAWLLQERHKDRMHQVKKEVGRAFNEHPNATGETYLQHLGFTCRMSLRLLYACMVLALHGFLPFLFTRTASTQIETIYTIMRSRIPEQRRDEINQTPSDIR